MLCRIQRLENRSVAEGEIFVADALHVLADFIRLGRTDSDGKAKELLSALFGGRYHKNCAKDALIRDALSLAGGSEDAQDDSGDGRSDGRSGWRPDGVPFAGLTAQDNPPSGPYGGASLVWFPVPGHGSILTFVVGTRGLSPDEGLLTRPGHRRRVAALRRRLAALGVSCWTKSDPSALGIPVPEVTHRQFPGFERALKRYGHQLYCIAQVPGDDAQRDLAHAVIQTFFDLYAHERNWPLYKAAEADAQDLIDDLRADLFPAVTAEQVKDLVLRRRFVVLQGPPGTGKTRLANLVQREHFGGRGMTVQFHPAVTYEDFVIGLSPDTKGGTLHFNVRPGWLLAAARDAVVGAESDGEGDGAGGGASDGAAGNGSPGANTPYLLVIDEVNRADLGKVLGEAIYLFEAGEVGGPNARRVKLPHAVDGAESFSLPKNLYVLATMNTADRSIAGMDLAVRRRFAFVTVPPDRSVVVEVARQGLPQALEVFDKLQDVFVEHAPDDALVLLPGHSYFLAKDKAELRQRFKYELLPLIDEYLREGFLGPCAAELRAVRDFIEDGLDGLKAAPTAPATATTRATPTAPPTPNASPPPTAARGEPDDRG